MSRDLDLSLVRTFVLASDHASMTAASRLLHRTQGAVSQQIKRLEASLGAALFQRGPKGLLTTPFGEQFLPLARQLVALNDEVWLQAKSSGGRVRLGLPYDLVGTFAAKVKTYIALHPAVDVSIDCRSSPELLGALKKGEVDVVVAEEPEHDAVGEILTVKQLVWVGAVGGQSHLRSPLAVSMVSPACVFRPAVSDALEKACRRWRPIYESGSLEATVAMVGADLAVTTWLAGLVPAALNVLHVGSGLPELPRFALSLHFPDKQMPSIVSAMAEALRN